MLALWCFLFICLVCYKVLCVFGCGVLIIVVWVCGDRLATLILDLLLG